MNSNERKATHRAVTRVAILEGLPTIVCFLRNRLMMSNRACLKRTPPLARSFRKGRVSPLRAIGVLLISCQLLDRKGKAREMRKLITGALLTQEAATPHPWAFEKRVTEEKQMTVTESRWE